MEGPVSATMLRVAQRTAGEVLREMVEMFAYGDSSDAAAIVAVDYLDHQGLEGEPVRGVDGFSLVVQTNRAGYEHHEVSIEDLFGTGDRAVARIRWRGRRLDGIDIDRETIDIVRVVDGQAVEHWGAEA